MFQMEQIPGDFCADNLALILKAKGVSVLAEHLQLFTTSLQANIKLIGQEMRDQKIKKDKREQFASTNYFRLTQAPPPGLFEQFVASISNTTGYYSDAALYVMTILELRLKLLQPEGRGAEIIPQDIEDAVDLQDLESHDANMLEYIAGWAISAARKAHPELCDIVSFTGTDIQISTTTHGGTAKFHFKPSPAFTSYFIDLSRFIHQRLTLHNLHNSGPDLITNVESSVAHSKELRSKFNSLFPSSYRQQHIDLLLSTITKKTLKSATKQFIEEQSLRPQKQSYALRNQLGVTSQSSSSEVIASKKSKTTETYCICGKPDSYDDTMVYCENKQCKIQWYHLKCIGLCEEDLPEGVWLCPKCVSTNES